MNDEKKPQSDKPAKSLRDQLSDEVQTTPWHFLKPHSERDGLIVVSQNLDLLDAGCAIVANDADAVQAWVSQGTVFKPTKEQLDAWNQEPTKEFKFLIAQPWVVIQETSH